jgi:hypothetical protein
MSNTSVAEHLSCAKRDIAAGDKSLRSAADHIAAAKEGGATQADVASTVGKSQPWVSRLLKWRDGGFKDGGPFADDNAKAKISRTNKSSTPRRAKKKEPRLKVVGTKKTTADPENPTADLVEQAKQVIRDWFANMTDDQKTAVVAFVVEESKQTLRFGKAA